MDLENLIIHGDTEKALDCVQSDSVHLTFTSPPYYNAREYSKYASYCNYLSFLKSVFTKIYKITKEGRFCVVNTSPVIEPRMDRQHQSKRYAIPYDLHHIMSEIGWDFIDDIIWVKPEASVKNRNGSFSQHRKPLAYKPNAITEMVMVYRKHTDKLIDWNIKKYQQSVIEDSIISQDYETSNVWHISPTSDVSHPAVFPLELCNKIISYYSMVGDLILDPFAGSGTVGLSAFNLKRHYLLIEQHKPYINRIFERLHGEEDIFNGNPLKTKIICI